MIVPDSIDRLHDSVRRGSVLTGCKTFQIGILQTSTASAASIGYMYILRATVKFALAAIAVVAAFNAM